MKQNRMKGLKKKKNPQPSVLNHLGAAEVFLPHTCLATVAEVFRHWMLR